MDEKSYTSKGIKMKMKMYEFFLKMLEPFTWQWALSIIVPSAICLSLLLCFK